MSPWPSIQKPACALSSRRPSPARSSLNTRHPALSARSSQGQLCRSHGPQHAGSIAITRLHSTETLSVTIRGAPSCMVPRRPSQTHRSPWLQVVPPHSGSVDAPWRGRRPPILEGIKFGKGLPARQHLVRHRAWGATRTNTSCQYELIKQSLDVIMQFLEVTGKHGPYRKAVLGRRTLALFSRCCTSQSALAASS